VNLANGTERNHEPGERVSVRALEDMLEVALALLEELARGHKRLFQRGGEQKEDRATRKGKLLRLESVEGRAPGLHFPVRWEAGCPVEACLG